MVNKNWTIEEALAANHEAINANPQRSENDPSLPLFQWVALLRLDECERNYHQDGYWLMMAIRICANHDLPLPEWASKAYINAFDKVHNYRAKSWDSVFGSPFPKGQHLHAARKRRMYSIAVWNEIVSIKKMAPDIPIDESLFEQVGKKFNIGKTLASEYYYSEVDKFNSYISGTSGNS